MSLHQADSDRTGQFRILFELGRLSGNRPENRVDSRLIGKTCKIRSAPLTDILNTLSAAGLAYYSTGRSDNAPGRINSLHITDAGVRELYLATSNPETATRHFPSMQQMGIGCRPGHHLFDDIELIWPEALFATAQIQIPATENAQRSSVLYKAQPTRRQLITGMIDELQTLRETLAPQANSIVCQAPRPDRPDTSVASAGRTTKATPATQGSQATQATQATQTTRRPVTESNAAVRVDSATTPAAHFAATGGRKCLPSKASLASEVKSSDQTRKQFTFKVDDQSCDMLGISSGQRLRLGNSLPRKTRQPSRRDVPMPGSYPSLLFGRLDQQSDLHSASTQNNTFEKLSNLLKQSALASSKTLAGSRTRSSLLASLEEVNETLFSFA